MGTIYAGAVAQTRPGELAEGRDLYFPCQAPGPAHGGWVAEAHASIHVTEQALRLHAVVGTAPEGWKFPTRASGVQ